MNPAPDGPTGHIVYLQGPAFPPQGRFYRVVHRSPLPFHIATGQSFEHTQLAEYLGASSARSIGNTWFFFKSKCIASALRLTSLLRPGEEEV
jgi:hypothetical protein